MKLRHTAWSTTKLTSAIPNRKRADTSVPITPPISLTASMRCCSTNAVAAMAMEPTMTMVECPSENMSPTVTGRFPCCISLRVTLSMAAI